MYRLTFQYTPRAFFSLLDREFPFATTQTAIDGRCNSANSSQLKVCLRCRRPRWNEGCVFQNIGGDNIRCTYINIKRIRIEGNIQKWIGTSADLHLMNSIVPV